MFCQVRGTPPRAASLSFGVVAHHHERAMKRILLFALTNIAVLAVLSITVRLLGLDRYLNEQGIHYGSLLVFAAIFGMGGAFLSLAMSKWSAKRMVGAHVIEQPADATEQWLWDTVSRQAQAAGIGMPEVAIYEAPEVNAFATGMNKNNALVAVSTGLLQAMNRDEAEAVLGHEVSHVANGDMVTLTLIQGVLNTFVIFLSRVIGHLIDRVVFKTERGYGPGFMVVSIVAQLLLGVLATLIVMGFSRQREFRADAGSATLSGGHKMIAALRKLQQQQGASTLPERMTSLGISGPLGHGLKRLFMTHPPLEERIEALRRSAAGA
jgi:heat shock protein HtpX